MNGQHQATVIRSTRRSVILLDQHLKQLKAHSSTRTLETTVGDHVLFAEREQDLVIQEILPRKNKLERRDKYRSKVFAANVDHLFIVSSMDSLFNTGFIDRALITSAEQNIPATLIINKADLELSYPSELSTYQKHNIATIFTSTKTKAGLSEINEMLTNTQIQCAVFCGLSGVGKSSLLNALAPESGRTVGELSHRSGQGKQTTSQAQAFPFQNSSDNHVVLLIDLPGFSQFGVTHIDINVLSRCYIEFLPYNKDCEFDNCRHRSEINCGVKKALQSGKIANFRYQSYLEILNELERSRKY